MMNRIITISREFGSGGRELGRRLAEQLHIAYYDQEIVSEISRRTELAEQYIEQVIEQKPLWSFPIHIGRSLLYPMNNPVFEQRQAVMLEQDKIIREMAEKSDCVIVGRCGDYILKDFQPFRVFIYAELSCRVNRCIDRQAEQEHYTRAEMEQKVLSIDKSREKYYEFYTGQKWGDPLNYDICINTSKRTPKEIASHLAEILS